MKTNIFFDQQPRPLKNLHLTELTFTLDLELFVEDLLPVSNGFDSRLELETDKSSNELGRLRGAVAAKRLRLV